MRIEIWNPGDTDRLSVLTDDHEDHIYKFEGLEFKTNLWGFLSATFSVRRSITDYWEDLEDSNLVRIYEATIVWEGEIEAVERRTDAENSYSVQCVGLCNRLKNVGTDYNGADLDPAEKMSTFITDHILTDSDLGLVAGTINTDDYEFVVGATFSPGKFYQEILETGTEYNEYRPAVWEGKTLDWKPRETTPTYYVHLLDCEQVSLNRTRNQVKNWVQVAYSPDGSTYGYVTDSDTDSIALHGKRCLYLAIEGDDVDAQQVATAALQQYATLKPSSTLTTDIIRDQYGALVDPAEVRALKVLHVESLLTTEETVTSANSINESNTWEIAETSYKDGKVSLSPGDAPATLDVILARLGEQWVD